MTKRARWILISCVAAVVLSLPGLIAWQIWRDHALLGFCKDARPGMSFTDLVSLERRHWINGSYLIQTVFKGYMDQAHSYDLEFRSHFFDPDFACAITHDGHTVTSVQLLTLQGFKAE
jgi:hypothetical protein